MFAELNPFEYCEIFSLENADLQNALKELDEYNDTPVCSTPKASNCFLNLKANFIFDFSTTTKTDNSHCSFEAKEDENNEENRGLIKRNIQNAESNVLSNKSDKPLLKIQKTEKINERNLNMNKEFDDSESYSSEEDCENFQLPHKQKDDALNRTILRSVKRFYLNLFKESNKKLKRKRFRNVKSNNFITALENMIVAHILPNIQKDSQFMHQNSSNMQILLNMFQSDQSNESFNSLVVFLFRFIGLKNLNLEIKYEEDSEGTCQLQVESDLIEFKPEDRVRELTKNKRQNVGENSNYSMIQMKIDLPYLDMFPLCFKEKGETRFKYSFIGLKPNDRVRFSNESEAKGEQIQSCMYNYSHPKMLKICEILEFRILFRYVYYYHLDSLFEKDKTLSRKRKSYMSAFHNMNKLIMRKYSGHRGHKN